MVERALFAALGAAVAHPTATSRVLMLVLVGSLTLLAVGIVETVRQEAGAR